MPPPSSGGILLAQMMKMIENRNIAQYGFQSPKAVQLMVEVERRAYADRAAHIGDPDFWKVPVKTLLDNTYLNNRMKDYDSTKASPSATIKAGSIRESNETTHISILDKDGNMVSITTTLNGSYGSRTVIGGAGFIMNNEMDDFSVKPNTPNMYGAIGGAANAIQPNKRMLSSMTPTLVLRNKKPFIVVGTPGGTTIPTSVFQTLVNLLEFKMTPEDAVNQPKFHHQWLPDEIKIEPTFPENTMKVLETMGYKFATLSQIGRTELIKINKEGARETIADKRGDDSVSGF
jgi:gamma-glutamyltranspeptidase/glutathione hydrolase